MEIRNVSYTYGNRQKQVLKDLTFTVGEGERISIVGTSGCGKTTLLHLMSGLYQPTEGEIILNERKMTGPSEEVAMIFQHYGLLPWKRVRDNIFLPLKLRREKILPEQIAEMAELLDLAEQMEAYPSQLSGGQKQRVAIGRALMSGARMILMDEPFSALDLVARKRLQKFLGDLFGKKKITSVIVTHNLEEALLNGNRILVFSPQGGSIMRILENPEFEQENYPGSELYFKRYRLITELLEMKLEEVQ